MWHSRERRKLYRKYPDPLTQCCCCCCYFAAAAAFQGVTATYIPILLILSPPHPHLNKPHTGAYYYARKAVVILFPAYVLCCMFEVLDPPRPMMENAWDSLMQALGDGPRVFSAAELKAKGVGSRPMLRFVVVVVVDLVSPAIICSAPPKSTTRAPRSSDQKRNQKSETRENTQDTIHASRLKIEYNSNLRGFRACPGRPPPSKPKL